MIYVSYTQMYPALQDGKSILKLPSAQVACVLGDWMEWSGCTRPCGGGQQTQVRAIVQEAG